jgi:hypothetical protein
MSKTSYTSTLARSALISFFLTTSAMAQSSVALLQLQVNACVANVANGDGTFVPAVQIVGQFGKMTQTRVGENGLTREMLYNKAALREWVLNGYPDEENVQVDFCPDTTNDDQDDPLAIVIPPPPENTCSGNDCKIPDIIICTGNDCFN